MKNPSVIPAHAMPVHVVQFGECVSCTNHKEYIAELRAALLNADDMLADIYVGKTLADDRWGAAFTKHDELGCSSEADENIDHAHEQEHQTLMYDAYGEP